MAPSPEYDKEPKAPDKSAPNISSDDTKLLHNLINDQQHSSDHKTTNAATNSEVENNKHVETLDDDKLRALLNEALTYKCPKDREGKSSLFKELLEEVEQDDQEACEAAARNLTGCRGSRRGARGRPPLPHSNSLQDLVAALAAEPVARRHARHHPPAHHHSTVSARAIHGGSLPSGVDTSSLLSEEGSIRPGHGAGYLATVRCVNPPPLAERRVSASDANAPQELELLNRRSKPMFPMTYTARATLEIGSGSVCSGRAVTTTTASNQVRSPPHPSAAPAPPSLPRARSPAARLGPLERRRLDQSRLMSALRANTDADGAGGGQVEPRGKDGGPRGPTLDLRQNDLASQMFVQNVDMWYEGLASYARRTRTVRHNLPDTSLEDTVYGDDAPSYTVPTKRTDLSYVERVAAPSSQTGKLKTFQGHNKYNSEKVNKESLSTKDKNVGRRQCDECRVLEHYKFCDKDNGDINIRKTYRERLVTKTVPTVPLINPRNIRSMSIGKPLPSLNVDSQMVGKNAAPDKLDPKTHKVKADEAASNPNIESEVKEISRNDIKSDDSRIETESAITKSMEDQTSKCFQMSDISSPSARAELAVGSDGSASIPPSQSQHDIELEEIVCHSASEHTRDTASTFSDYLADQENLFRVLGTTHSKAAEEKYFINAPDNDNETKTSEFSDDVEPMRESAQDVSSEDDVNTNTNNESEQRTSLKGGGELALAVRPHRRDERPVGDRYVLAELPNNAYIFLTLPKRSVAPLDREYRPAEVTELEDGLAKRPLDPKSKRKKDKPVGTSSSAKRKDAINKNALRVLLFENLLKSDRGEPTGGGASSADKEVDSAIPFSCITTPEVVATCNTTPSASQAAVALDPKPMQLDSEYRAVTSLVGVPPATATAIATATVRNRPDTSDEQPRSIIASTFSGLPLSRTNYGATATATATTSGEEYKKSLDENGNSVQGYSSPLSGSSQHKKPRRKKLSKNETLIDCRQIDGYQGDKDVNELLRFIESNAEQRAPKLRAKHKDDTEDKGKKRSTDRRKDKDKPKRASSLEELSRTKLEDLTAPRPAPPKPERRSWGDTAPPPPTPADIPPTPTPLVAEQADFQTVTKKRKPRRRTEETAPVRGRVPSPRRQDSAPPSDRSNDSNDDMDSVHSVPERAPPVASAHTLVHASYADIARTRHNIPDLIESCNFYADGELVESRRRVEAAPPATALPLTDTYPALGGADPPPASVAPARRIPRDKPAAATRRSAPPPAATTTAPPAECPAPDVVADRRPPVILLDSLARPRDMDGVTFGFDINEQLLGSGSRRPRCDLVRDAVEAPPPGVPVRAAKRALRYLPPPVPPHDTVLHQIVDYVGAAWEEVTRCGGGKVRYFSE